MRTYIAVAFGYPLIVLPVFVGNKGQLEGLLEMMERVVVDLTDPPGQRSALQFLARCVNAWAVPSPDGAPQALPGFERFIYERLVPATFRVLSLPEFNTKDGQVMMVRGLFPPISCNSPMLTTREVSYEIASFYQTVAKARGQETLDFFVSAFLPSQGWPQEMALDFVTKLRDLDNKAFKKYFTDIVRAAHGGS